MAEKIGFIGLGIMGRGMVSNLMKAGHDVVVWNRTTARMAEFVNAGAEAADHPADLAARSTVIMICVSDTPDVEEVILGENGVLKGASTGDLVIDHSSISPSATLRFMEQLNQKGIHMIDAPVSGGSEGADQGTLSVMVGGDPEDIERAMPYMDAFSKTVTHVGPSGSGQMVKLVNQVLVVITGLAVSEGLLFAQAGGLDLEKTIEAVKGGAAGSWMLSFRGPQMIERDWRPGFTIDLQQKDLRLVLDEADNLGIPMLATGLVFQLYRSLQARGLGEEGNHALVKALEEMSGVKLNS